MDKQGGSSTTSAPSSSSSSSSAPASPSSKRHQWGNRDYREKVLEDFRNRKGNAHDPKSDIEFVRLTTVPAPPQQVPQPQPPPLPPQQQQQQQQQQRQTQSPQQPGDVKLVEPSWSMSFSTSESSEMSVEKSGENDSSVSMELSDKKGPADIGTENGTGRNTPPTPPTRQGSGTLTDSGDESMNVGANVNSDEDEVKTPLLMSPAKQRSPRKSAGRGRIKVLSPPTNIKSPYEVLTEENEKRLAQKALNKSSKKASAPTVTNKSNGENSSMDVESSVDTKESDEEKPQVLRQQQPQQQQQSPQPSTPPRSVSLSPIGRMSSIKSKSRRKSHVLDDDDDDDDDNADVNLLNFEERKRNLENSKSLRKSQPDTPQGQRFAAVRSQNILSLPSFSDSSSVLYSGSEYDSSAVSSAAISETGSPFPVPAAYRNDNWNDDRKEHQRFARVRSTKMPSPPSGFDSISMSEASTSQTPAARTPLQATPQQSKAAAAVAVAGAQGSQSRRVASATVPPVIAKSVPSTPVASAPAVSMAERQQEASLPPPPLQRVEPLPPPPLQAGKAVPPKQKQQAKSRSPGSPSPAVPVAKKSVPSSLVTSPKSAKKQQVIAKSVPSTPLPPPPLHPQSQQAITVAVPDTKDDVKDVTKPETVSSSPIRKRQQAKSKSPGSPSPAVPVAKKSVPSSLVASPKSAKKQQVIAKSVPSSSIPSQQAISVVASDAKDDIKDITEPEPSTPVIPSSPKASSQMATAAAVEVSPVLAKGPDDDVHAGDSADAAVGPLQMDIVQQPPPTPPSTYRDTDDETEAQGQDADGDTAFDKEFSTAPIKSMAWPESFAAAAIDGSPLKQGGNIAVNLIKSSLKKPGTRPSTVKKRVSFSSVDDLQKDVAAAIAEAGSPKGKVSSSNDKSEDESTSRKKTSSSGSRVENKIARNLSAIFDDSDDDDNNGDGIDGEAAVDVDAVVNQKSKVREERVISSTPVKRRSEAESSFRMNIGDNDGSDNEDSFINHASPIKKPRVSSEADSTSEGYGDDDDDDRNIEAKLQPTPAKRPLPQLHMSQREVMLNNALGSMPGSSFLDETNDASVNNSDLLGKSPFTSPQKSVFDSVAATPGTPASPYAKYLNKAARALRRSTFAYPKCTLTSYFLLFFLSTCITTHTNCSFVHLLFYFLFAFSPKCKTVERGKSQGEEQEKA